MKFERFVGGVFVNNVAVARYSHLTDERVCWLFIEGPTGRSSQPGRLVSRRELETICDRCPDGARATLAVREYFFEEIRRAS